MTAGPARSSPNRLAPFGRHLSRPLQLPPAPLGQLPWPWHHAAFLLIRFTPFPIPSFASLTPVTVVTPFSLNRRSLPHRARPPAAHFVRHLPVAGRSQFDLASASPPSSAPLRWVGAPADHQSRPRVAARRPTGLLRAARPATWRGWRTLRTRPVVPPSRAGAATNSNHF